MKRKHLYESPEVRVSSINTYGFICVSIGELNTAIEVDATVTITDDPNLDFDNE